MPVKKRSGDAVHPVHDAPVRSKDHRIGEIHLAYESGVLRDLPHRRWRESIAKPVFRVELGNRCERYLLNWKGGRQLKETVHVPGIQTADSRPKVILLPHLVQSDPSQANDPQNAATGAPRTGQPAASPGLPNRFSAASPVVPRTTPMAAHECPLRRATPTR